MQEELFQTKYIAKNIEILELNKEKIGFLPSFLADNFNQIVEIANNLNLLKVSDKEHFNICLDETFKLEIFFDIISIEKYKIKVDEIFSMKHQFLERLLKNFEVFHYLK